MPTATKGKKNIDNTNTKTMSYRYKSLEEMVGRNIVLQLEYYIKHCTLY